MGIPGSSPIWVTCFTKMCTSRPASGCSVFSELFPTNCDLISVRAQRVPSPPAGRPLRCGSEGGGLGLWLSEARPPFGLQMRLQGPVSVFLLSQGASGFAEFSPSPGLKAFFKNLLGLTCSIFRLVFTTAGLALAGPGRPPSTHGNGSRRPACPWQVTSSPG